MKEDERQKINKSENAYMHGRHNGWWDSMKKIVKVRITTLSSKVQQHCMFKNFFFIVLSQFFPEGLKSDRKILEREWTEAVSKKGGNFTTQ